MPSPKQMILVGRGMGMRDCNNSPPGFRLGWGKDREGLALSCYLKELLSCSVLSGEGRLTVCSAGDLFALPTATSYSLSWFYSKLTQDH